MKGLSIKRYNFLIIYILIVVILYGLIGDINDNPISEDIKLAESSTKQEAEYDIFIDLTESMLYLFKNNELVKKYVVAQGKSGSPSPIGVWQIINKTRNWGTGFGSRWMGIDVPWGTYGIHGTNKPYSIGRKASAGCFRMHNKDVEEIYELVPYKTKVYVYGGPYNNLGSRLEVLSPGDRKSHVLEVQIRLKNKGYYEGAIDGIYGEGMKAALLRFKEDVGLPHNHFVDEATYEALGIFQFE